MTDKKCPLRLALDVGVVRPGDTLTMKLSVVAGGAGRLAVECGDAVAWLDEVADTGAVVMHTPALHEGDCVTTKNGSGRHVRGVITAFLKADGTPAQTHPQSGALLDEAYYAVVKDQDGQNLSMRRPHELFVTRTRDAMRVYSDEG